MSSDLTLRVVWPILDDRMYDAEAVTAAWFEWPAFVDRYEVDAVDTPRMRIVDLTAQQETDLGATRAVVCEAPVVRRGESRPPEAESRPPPRRRHADHSRWVVDERRHSTALLTREGLSSGEIATRLGVDRRTVYRYRQQYRLAS